MVRVHRAGSIFVQRNAFKDGSCAFKVNTHLYRIGELECVRTHHRNLLVFTNKIDCNGLTIPMRNAEWLLTSLMAKVTVEPATESMIDGWMRAKWRFLKWSSQTILKWGWISPRKYCTHLWKINAEIARRGFTANKDTNNGDMFTPWISYSVCYANSREMGWGQIRFFFFVNCVKMCVILKLIFVPRGCESNCRLSYKQISKL